MMQGWDDMTFPMKLVILCNMPCHYLRNNTEIWFSADSFQMYPDHENITYISYGEGDNFETSPGRKKGRKSHPCNLCNKSFSSTFNLRRHQQYHTGQFSFYCETCRRGFNERRHYNLHMNKHEGRSFPCQFCTKRYSSEQNMRDHMLSFHGKFVWCKFLAGKLLRPLSLVCFT